MVCFITIIPKKRNGNRNEGHLRRHKHGGEFNKVEENRIKIKVLLFHYNDK